MIGSETITLESLSLTHTQTLANTYSTHTRAQKRENIKNGLHILYGCVTDITSHKKWLFLHRPIKNAYEQQIKKAKKTESSI